MMRFTSQLRNARSAAIWLLVSSLLPAAKAEPASLIDSLVEEKLKNAELTKRISELEMVMEAVGVDALSGGREAVGLRLLHALRENRGLSDEVARLELVLAEAASDLLAVANGGASTNLSVTIPIIESVLQKITVERSSFSKENKNLLIGGLTQGINVVSLSPHFGLAIVNSGDLDGLEIGMPVSVVRNSEVIASGFVLETRKHVAGVFFPQTSLSVQVGDSVVVKVESQSF